MSNRAVIYCRVSTESEIQESSLEAQIAQARETVQSNGWILIDEYIDSGKSGTTTQNRIQYNRLMRNMQKNTFDIIVVKSQDRLMRSTKDWYLFIDSILKYNIKVFFYLENYFYVPDDALITGVKAILAEEFSRELSKKINNAHKNRQHNGRIMISSRTLGYRNNNGVIEIDEEEAEIVRLIFQLRIEGYGVSTISRILAAKGIYSKKNTLFGSSSITKVLRNTIYYGSMTMNRKHFDFESKTMVWNQPEEWIIRENALPAIIDYETWKKANDLMDYKSSLYRTNITMKEFRGKKPTEHPLSGKIHCGECGSVFMRSRQKRKYDYTLRWLCKEYIIFGRKDAKQVQLMKTFDPNYSRGCNNISVSDEDIKKVMIMIFNETPEINKNLIEQTTKLTNQVFKEFYTLQRKNYEKAMQELQRNRSILLDSYLETKISKEVYQLQQNELKEQEIMLKQKHYMEEEMETRIFESKSNRSKIKERVTELVNEDLAESYMYEKIKRILVFENRMIFSFLEHPDIEISIDRSNYRKRKYQIVKQ